MKVGAYFSPHILFEKSVGENFQGRVSESCCFCTQMINIVDECGLGLLQPGLFLCDVIDVFIGQRSCSLLFHLPEFKHGSP